MTRALAIAAVLAFALVGAQPKAAPSAFAPLVDEYLEQFAARHPSIAAGNGLHQHDDRLEEFSAGAIAAEAGWLKTFRARLDGSDPAVLTPDERVDRRILQGLVDAWLLDLEGVKTWQKNPMIYAAAITDGVHDLMTMESAPAPERMRNAAAKLRAVPRLLQSARENIHNPPRLFVERGVVMLHGASELLGKDLSLAFAGVRDAALQAELRAAAAGARTAIDQYATELNASAATATGSYVVGTANLEARYRDEELIDLPAATLLAIGRRELARSQQEFTETAARIDPNRPALDVWRGVLADHPKRGELAAAAQRTVDELLAFVTAKHLVDLPPGERVIVAPAPEFDLGLASMHSSPPLEPHPVKSFYYVTDARAEWPPDRQNAWLEKFNYPTLAIITAHEVYPGHYAHSLFMRKTPGKIRKIWIGLNPFPQPSSGQDGWAHYAEQLVIDQGFKQDDPRYKLAQLSEAMTRICRLISGIELHTGAWTVDRAAELFEKDAHLPAPAARQEAVRGTYDPTYGGYFLGKMAALKLRRDDAAALGDRFDLKAFHERVMTDGIAPWWAHRQLLLPGDRGAVIE